MSDEQQTVELPSPVRSHTDALETDLEQVVNLERNRAWLSLKEHLFNRRDSERERLIRAIFRKHAEPVDQREVDYARGVIDTLEWMLTLPERVKLRQQQPQGRGGRAH